MAADSKTEKATPKKRRDERKKGNVFLSKDIVNVASVLAIFTLLRIYFPFMFDYMELMVHKYIGLIKLQDAMTIGLMSQITIDGIIAILLLAGPIMFTALAVGVIASGAQTKFNISKDSIKPKFSRLSPLKGFKRMVSMRSFVEVFKSILKISIIGYVLYLGFKKIISSFSTLVFIGTLQALSFILQSIMDIVLQITLIFAVIAFFDYLYQWWEYEKNLKMSKQDLKEEYKQTEGDPQLKGKIKEKQRQMAFQRMMQDVPEADVVIKNPTHFAVALKYDPEKNKAPTVVAKGQDYTALKILQIAEENHIPTKEDKPLARALYQSVEIGQEIRSEFYGAMAEILAWVFTLKKENNS